MENWEQRNNLKHQFESKFNEYAQILNTKYNVITPNQQDKLNKRNTKSVEPNKALSFQIEQDAESHHKNDNSIIASLWGLPKVFHNKLGIKKSDSRQETLESELTNSQLNRKTNGKKLIPLSQNSKQTFSKPQSNEATLGFKGMKRKHDDIIEYSMNQPEYSLFHDQTEHEKSSTKSNTNETNRNILKLADDTLNFIDQELTKSYKQTNLNQNKSPSKSELEDKFNNLKSIGINLIGVLIALV